MLGYNMNLIHKKVCKTVRNVFHSFNFYSTNVLISQVKLNIEKFYTFSNGTEQVQIEKKERLKILSFWRFGLILLDNELVSFPGAPVRTKSLDNYSSLIEIK